MFYHEMCSIFTKKKPCHLIQPVGCLSVCMQGPLGQLKDLVDLKDQLEDIQRRMEDEIQAGVPPVSSHRH